MNKKQKLVIIIWLLLIIISPVGFIFWFFSRLDFINWPILEGLQYSIFGGPIGDNPFLYYILVNFIISGAIAFAFYRFCDDSEKPDTDKRSFIMKAITTIIVVVIISICSNIWADYGARNIRKNAMENWCHKKYSNDNTKYTGCINYFEEQDYFFGSADPY